MGAMGGAVVVAILAVLAVVIAGASSGSADEPATGVPLTKEQYFEKSGEVYAAVAKADRLYYVMALDPLSRKQCARKARRLASNAARAVAIADSVQPPPEITALHARLVKAGESVVRKFRLTAKPVLAGRLDCLGASGRIGDIYERSPLDKIEEKLRELGYVPSGY